MSARIPGGEPDGMQESDQESRMPVAAGVSSLSDANGSRTSPNNGARPRSSPRPSAASGASAASAEGGGQDLEDLPF